MTSKSRTTDNGQPEFDDAEVNDKDLTPETVPDDEPANEDDELLPGESMIVHRETYMDGAVQKTREHGPMPLHKWHDYAKEHGF